MFHTCTIVHLALVCKEDGLTPVDNAEVLQPLTLNLKLVIPKPETLNRKPKTRNLKSQTLPVCLRTSVPCEDRFLEGPASIRIGPTLGAVFLWLLQAMRVSRVQVLQQQHRTRLYQGFVSHFDHGRPIFRSKSAVELIRHISDGQGQIMALAFRQKS